VKFRRVLVVGAVCAALAASACGTPAAAATVNGTRIDRSSFERELKALNENDQLQEQAGPAGLSGTGKKTVDSRLAAGWLTAVIYDALITEEFNRRKLKLTKEDTEAAAAQFGTQFGDPKVADAFPSWFRKLLTERNARAMAVRTALTGVSSSEESLRQYYEQHQADFQQVCLSHILVETEPEATAVISEIKAAPDEKAKFAEVAKAKSTDTGSGPRGGDLDCNPKGTFVEAFDQAAFSVPLNTISDPVQTQFGFHVLLVRERRTQPFEEARTQAKSQLNSESQDKFRAFLDKAARKAKVTVDPRFGTYVVAEGEAPEVVPPAKPNAPDGRPSEPPASPGGDRAGPGDEQMPPDETTPTSGG
jgi:parvulin-like peptidyl-prolyl isomerase